jgi:hypothetical protein
VPHLPHRLQHLLVALVDAERSEGSLGGNERHAAALLVMPPDGVVALGAHLFDQFLLEQALNLTESESRGDGL